MMLALETATEVCSVSLKTGKGEIFEKRTEEKGVHSERLFLFIEGLRDRYGFAIADLEAVLVSEGPGSYTGLRIAASAVKGLLFRSGVELYGFNTLASYAQAALTANPDLETIHSIIDARRKHLYYQKFTVLNGQIKAATGVSVKPLAEMESLLKKEDGVIGTGLERLEEAILEGIVMFDSKTISANSLFDLFETENSDFIKQVRPEDFEPKYYTSGQAQR